MLESLEVFRVVETTAANSERLKTRGNIKRKGTEEVHEKQSSWAHVLFEIGPNMDRAHIICLHFITIFKKLLICNIPMTKFFF